MARRFGGSLFQTVGPQTENARFPNSVRLLSTTAARKLTTDTIKALVNARVVNRIDYCNAVLADVHDIHLRQLQGVLDAAARLLFCRRKYDSISFTMRDLLH